MVSIYPRLNQTHFDYTQMNVLIDDGCTALVGPFQDVHIVLLVLCDSFGTQPAFHCFCDQYKVLHYVKLTWCFFFVFISLMQEWISMSCLTFLTVIGGSIMMMYQ